MNSPSSCVYCKGPTDPHCAHAGCSWLRCTECQAVLWTSAARALHRGLPVPWPYSRPD
jgi:hypothetical protein